MTVQIAQTRLEAVGLLLENKETMRPCLSESVGDAKLERHIEAWDREVT